MFCLLLKKEKRNNTENKKELLKLLINEHLFKIKL